MRNFIKTSSRQQHTWDSKTWRNIKNFNLMSLFSFDFWDITNTFSRETWKFLLHFYEIFQIWISFFIFNFKDLWLKYFIVEKKDRFNRKINNAHTDYIYVEILYHFVKKIKNSKISYNLNSTMQKNVTKKFEQTFERITFICSISSFDAITIQFSKLDSLKEFNECTLKRYNKTNIILKSFQFVVT
jgi:hypothetical protein